VKVAVTGATGYVGREFVSFVNKSLGVELYVLSRSDPRLNGVTWCYYDLAQECPILPSSLDVIVHLASNTKHDELSADIEITAASRLLEEAGKTQARFIFVSSQTASKNAKSSYGKTKWQIEKLVQEYGGISVRPGQVYGGSRRGLYGRIVELVDRLPFLPDFGDNVRVQLIHVEELSEILARLLTENFNGKEIFFAADPNWTSFRSYLTGLAETQVKKRRLFVRVPKFILIVAAWIFPNQKSLESLNSLFSLPYMHTAASLATMDITLRNFDTSLQKKSGTDRHLLEEGKILFEYLIGKSFSNFSLRGYVRAIKSLRSTGPLNIPILARVFPSMLGVYESASRFTSSASNELLWRVAAATQLSESTVAGAAYYFGEIRKYPVLRSVTALFLAGLFEALYRSVGGLIFCLRKLPFSNYCEQRDA
jgi:nucleoside-diphosphate-sugar epimerase